MIIKDPVIKSSQVETFSGKIVTPTILPMIFTATTPQPLYVWLSTLFSPSSCLKKSDSTECDKFSKQAQILTELFALSSSLNKPSNLLLLVSPVVKLKQNNLLLVCLARGWSNVGVMRNFLSSSHFSPLTLYSYLFRYPDQTRDICVC